MSQIEKIYERLRDDLEMERPSDKQSEIIQFYEGKTLFITGATGFLGKCLIEKLLRSCWGVKHIYVLMREKKNMKVDELLSKYFQNKIFDRLREIHPNFESKVTALKGDISEDKLGLSEEDIKTLRNEINIMIHNAANVKFEIRVNLALRVNVLGTNHMLDLAMECPNLQLFMYVSTAYSHCYQKDIEETFYESPADINEVNVLIRKDSEIKNGLPKETVKVWLGKFPNIYTYTKAISEELVRQRGQKAKFVCAVYRPSIVTFAYKEPLAGWIGNNNGPVLVMIGISLGLIHTFYYANFPMDFIPSDYTINALLAASWDAHTHRNNTCEAVVYNFGSTTVNPINIGTLENIWQKNCSSTVTSEKTLWKEFVIITTNSVLFWTCHILFHLIPAGIADLVLFVMGKKPRALAIFWFATKNFKALDYFTNGNWKIHMKKTQKMIENLNSKDREIFYCDMRPETFDWSIYTEISWQGILKYILKEKVDPNRSYRRYILFNTLHYVLIIMLTLLIGNWLLSWMSNIFLTWDHIKM